MLKRLQLVGVGPAPRMQVEFGDRLNLLTGDNGLGKSFLLDAAWWALTRNWAGNAARPRDEAPTASIAVRVKARTNAVETKWVFRHPQQSWVKSQGRPVMPGVVVYARVDGGFSVWDPTRHYWRIAPSVGVDDPDRLPALHFESSALWNGLEKNGRRTCEGLIRDWVLWQTSNDSSLFDNLKQVLRALSSPEEPIEPDQPVRVSLDDGFDTPTIRTSYDRRVPLTHASAAVRRVCGLAYLLVWAWREHIKGSKVLRKRPENRLVLLIDEPETHLHPKWQRAIIPAVFRAAKAMMQLEQVKIQLIAATHSPLVLASVEPEFDPKTDSLIDLQIVPPKNGGFAKVEANTVEWQRRGDVTAWLTSEIFELRQARSREAEEAIEQASKLLSASPPDSKALKELDRRLRKLLGELDSFWIGWRYAGEKGGWLKRNGSVK
ncbi:MAG: AAA family ATPase [Deltaproteobacteria bacterium]|nr:AAA family ATPase [Deltaproteobacteria bacterium]